MPDRPLVLDSWAVLAFVQDEPSAAEVERLFLGAQRGSGSLCMTSVNLGEVWYSIARRRSDSVAESTVAEILRLGITVVAADWILARAAAELKAGHPIAYADCYAAALALQLDTEVVTGDPEFKQLQKKVKIHWL